MSFDKWNELSGLQHIIYLGAVAAALTAIYTMYKWVWPKVKSVHRKYKWFMSDENEHKIIMERLDSIAEKLEPNGGSAIPDTLKRIETTVIFLSARQQAFLHTNNNPVFETDRNGKVVFINNAYKKLFGIDSKDAIGMGWVNIISPNVRQDTIEKWFMAVKDRRNFDEFLTLMDHTNNRIKVHVVAYVIRGEDDEVLGHHGEVVVVES